MNERDGVNPLNFDISTFLEFIVSYYSAVLKHLDPLGPDAKAIGQQIMLSSMVTNPLRFDIRTDAAIALNDLEADRRYSVWPKSLGSLLRPPSSQFYPIARNTVLLTLVIDVFATRLKFLQEVVKMVSQMIPIQVRLVLVDGSAGCDSDAVRALYAVYFKYGRIIFTDLLIRVTHTVI